MPRITFVAADGSVQAVDAKPGPSLMEVAAEHHVPGIVGECGGACTCATCHVHIDEPWLAKLPPASSLETSVLRTLASDLRPASRLSCTIRVTAALDGLVVHVPRITP